MLAAGCTTAPPQTDPVAPSLLADVGGPIRLALTVVTSPSRSALRNQALVETLVRRLGPQAHMLILAPPEMVVEPNPWPERMTFVPISPELRLTIWPQDPFVVLRDPDGSARLLSARDYGRAQDREMAEAVASQLGWPVERSSLFFAGGNVLADERHAFVGAALVQENVADLGWSENEVLRRFEDELGLPVILVEQVVEHVDMVITPLGRGRVAVADAAAGASLAEQELERNPDAVRLFEESAERNFFGDPAVQTITDTEGRVVGPPPVIGEIRRAIADSSEMAPRLDAIARYLASRGYDVVRMPFLATRSTPRRSASYPMLSYNNVLIERVDGRDHVFVAEYGLAVLDRAGADVWQAAGFDVHPIPGVTTGAMYRGSVRCTVKVLEREALPTP
jgi:hypothetical protein